MANNWLSIMEVLQKIYPPGKEGSEMEQIPEKIYTQEFRELRLKIL